MNLAFEDYTVARHDCTQGHHYRYASSSGKALFFYAAHHSNDPEHPQFADIAQQVAAFAPDAVGYEGKGQWSSARSHEATIKQYGEQAYTARYAQSLDIPTYPLEFSALEEVAGLRTRFADDLIFSYLIFRTLGQMHREQDRGTTVAQELQMRITRLQQLFGDVASLATLENVSVRELGAPFKPDIKALIEPFQRAADPRLTGTSLNEVARFCTYLRDQSVYTNILSLLRTYDRVFAIMGASHPATLDISLRHAMHVANRGEV